MYMVLVDIAKFHEQVMEAKKNKTPIIETLETFGVSKSTYYRLIDENGEDKWSVQYREKIATKPKRMIRVKRQDIKHKVNEQNIDYELERQDINNKADEVDYGVEKRYLNQKINRQKTKSMGMSGGSLPPPNQIENDLIRRATLEIIQCDKDREKYDEEYIK